MRRRNLLGLGLGFLVGFSGCGDFSFERFVPDRIKMGVMSPVRTSFKNLDEEEERIKRGVDLVARDYKPGTLREGARRFDFWIPQTEFEYFSGKDGMKKSFNVRLGLNSYTTTGKDHIYPSFFPRLSLKNYTEGTIGLVGVGWDVYPVWKDRIKLHFGAEVEAHYYDIYSRTNVGVGGLTLLSFRDRIRGAGGTFAGRVGVESDLGFLPEGWSVSLIGEQHWPLYNADDAEGFRLAGYLVKEIGKD
ncbi:MAG: hypothetical protein ABIG28_03725 [archaeon]